MIDNKKRRNIIVGICLVVALVVIAIVFAVVNIFNGNHKAAIPTPKTSISTKQSTKETSESSEKDSTSSEEQDTDKEATPKENLQNFIKSYVTYDLNDNSIQKRASYLETLMTHQAYASSYIAQDAQTLSAMVKTYKKTKQINTSNSTQLVARSYKKGSIYQSSDDKNKYFVEIEYLETPIYQKEGYMVDSKYDVTMDENKVAAINLTESKNIPGGNANNG
ncbi:MULTISPECIES: hypothetical protein [Lactococcus]|nr:hypothetical protein [Lactococcus lactis]MDT2861054.1 hypothetical protein [Lactococcus lactis]MDT2869104.1 hypothetical protein [Lactococcus lactis]MDT2874506.1 hypothetical protein [Lactococcus lactis]MDT2879665.1 hypothetical protein [Lactococcus lactis]MDT2888264.1 hypothetical protein [Lactococcus lactis]